MKKILEKVYLGFIRKNIFVVLFFLTQNIRKKVLKTNEVKEILVFGLNRLGDNVLSSPALKAIKASFPEAKIAIISNRYVRDVLLIDNSATEILFYRNENIFKQLKTVVMILKRRWDLAIDFTCDYTFLPAFILFLSGAKFRIGYNIEERGFLFNRPVNWENQKKHFVDRLSDILKEIDIEVMDKKANLSVTEDSRKFANNFLETNNVLKSDLLVGIHPGGYYPSQRWPIERFAEVADRIVKKYNAKVIIMAGEKERQLLEVMSHLMQEKAIKAYSFSILQLMGLIKRCNLFICNNSGLLHLATALDVPTISTMGPTDSLMWWPQGENSIVLKKDLPCLGCKRGFCHEHDCMNLITVNEMFEAVEAQIKKIKKAG